MKCNQLLLSLTDSVFFVEATRLPKTIEKIFDTRQCRLTRRKTVSPSAKMTYVQSCSIPSRAGIKHQPENIRPDDSVENEMCIPECG